MRYMNGSVPGSAGPRLSCPSLPRSPPTCRSSSQRRHPPRQHCCRHPHAESSNIKCPPHAKNSNTKWPLIATANKYIKK